MRRFHSILRLPMLPHEPPTTTGLYEGLGWGNNVNVKVGLTSGQALGTWMQS